MKNKSQKLLSISVAIYLLMVSASVGFNTWLMFNPRGDRLQADISDRVEKEVDRSYNRFFTQFNFAIFLIGTSVWILRQSVINNLQTDFKKQFKEELEEDFNEELKSLRSDLTAQRQKDELIQEISIFLPPAISFFQEEIKPDIQIMLQELTTKLHSLEEENSRLRLTFEDYTKWGDGLFYLANYQVLDSYQSINSWFKLTNSPSYKGKSKKIIKQYEEAIAKYKQAIDIKETYYAWLGLGNSLWMLEDYREAIECYDRAIQLERLPFMALVNKGLVHRRLHEDEKEGVKEGIEYFDQAILIAPNYPRAWYNKACYYALLGNSDEALRNLEEAINLAPLKAKQLAEEDSDFNLIKEDERFKKLFQSLRF
jgi:tetratricopeptide (TPR) repeat protein